MHDLKFHAHDHCSMAGDSSSLSKADVLAHLLQADESQPRDEPEIAANIGAQLQHMGLSSWSLSMIRRTRDSLAKLQPDRVIEVGGGIGYRSAWYYDLFSRQESHPSRYDIVEDGAKFGVIIHRLMTRYSAEDYTKIVVGNLESLVGETNAWKAASSSGLDVGESPLQIQADAIVVGSESSRIASDVEMMLPFLSPTGLLLCSEPDVPTGDIAADAEAGMKMVQAFNEWMELIKSSQEKFHVAFMPIFGGTLVGFMPK